MIVFWIAAALLAAAAAGLILYRAARAEQRAGATGDPSLSVYRRQLHEIDDLSDRGLLAAEEQRSARAEAARRLLAAANDPSDALSGGGPSSGLARRLTLAAAATAPLIALAVYLHVGAPGAADQPFANRLAAWRAGDPQSLDAAQMAAVLGQAVTEHPGDPQPLYYLARTDLAVGDAFGAERALRKAIALAPRRADLWTALGVTLMTAGGGPIAGDALKAFQQAHALDPKAADPRYFLARARIMSGDVKGGLVDWRALAVDLPTADPRKADLLDEIAAVEKAGMLSTAPAPASPTDTAGFVQSMVDRLAARLAAQPDDPAGWGRLIHAYGVLGDDAKRQAAVERAHSLFKDRPAALAAVDAAAQGPR